ncbi:MAG: hypothetical protein JO279_00905 [Verrucomicrobia bacterium]|nr:hypothetical protein [Verrucomicrobiota bacterium]
MATIYFEVTTLKGIDSLISDNVDWRTKEQSVQIDKASEQKEDFENSGRKWSRISWDGDSKDWGPAKVGFLFTEAGKGKILTVTYWISKGSGKRFPGNRQNAGQRKANRKLSLFFRVSIAGV